MENNEMKQNPSAFDGPHTIYARYDDGFVVRSMTSADVPTVINWWMTVPGANVPPDDLIVTLKSFRSSDRGFYIGTFDDRPVAAFVAPHWGNGFCFGGFWIVDEAYRGFKFGIRIRDEVALLDVGPTRTLCLHSMQGRVANMNTIYLGYRNVAVSETIKNFEVVTTDCYEETSKLSDSTKIKPAVCVELDKIIQYDNKCFISQNFAPRRNFLRLLIQVQNGASFVALNDVTGDVVGFGCRRMATKSGHHKIGPLYADSHEIAECLFAKLCAGIPGQTVRISCYGEHAGSMALVEKFNLRSPYDLVHQHINAEPASGVEFKPQVYAITSVSVCGA